MATRIPNLWSQEDVKVEVLSPLAILRTQAENLEQMTKGLIEAEVTTATGEKGEIVYQLDIIAPVLGGYRHRLLAVSHQKDMVYPVRFVTSIPHVISVTSAHPSPYDTNVFAETEAEFLGKLGELLRSNTVNAVIQSIIARSNEVQYADPKYKMTAEAAA